MQPRSPETDMPLSPRHLAALNQLVDDVLGISFSDWAEAGFWDNRYIPRMLFDGEDAVANVSVYSIDMVIRGAPCRVAQISTCATREDRRNQGLGSTLLAESLAQVRTDHDLVFVMSTDRAVPFYRRQGFEPVLEQIPTLVADRTSPRPGLLPLDVKNRDDLALIADKASTRTPVSQLCGVLSPKLLMFHALSVLPHCLFHVPDLGCLVMLKRRGRRLRIFDIVAPEMPTFADLYPYLAEGRRDLVKFAFLPDQLDVSGLRWRRSRANNLHVLPDTPVGLDLRRVLIPFTAKA